MKLIVAMRKQNVSISINLVYRDDRFDFNEKTQTISHRPQMPQSSDKITHVYAIANWLGGRVFVVLPWSEIEDAAKSIPLAFKEYPKECAYKLARKKLLEELKRLGIR
jgi:hypothetical protein